MATTEALEAAKWVVDLPDRLHRIELWSGHRMRRVPVMRDGFPAEDHTAANEWLIGQYRAAMEVSH